MKAQSPRGFTEDPIRVDSEVDQTPMAVQKSTDGVEERQESFGDK